MTRPLRLIVFDVDGTLVDSQADIVASMTRAFAAVDHPAPAREAVLSIIGVSLEEAMPRLAPGLPARAHVEMATAYREAYMALRTEKGAASSPLYPGTLELLAELGGTPETLLGIATGKSRRGLDAVLAGHGLERVFITRQVADDHPSKPHPSMLLAAMAETGVTPDHTVMVGDTAYDMDMARAAGVASVAVGWGYHPPETLAGDRSIATWDELPAALTSLWGAEA